MPARNRALASIQRLETPLMLAGLVLAQWVAVALFALDTKRNGWLFYQGGDQTAYWTTAWVISDRELPVTPIGYIWSFALAPLAEWAGPNLILALPAIVVLQFALLLPLAVLAVFALAARLGGRRFGYAVAALWVAAPFVAHPLFVERYHERYVEQVLPQSLGLTAMADFPSMVALLVTAVLLFRAFDRGSPLDAVLAGVACGVALGIKPANMLFLAGPALAYLAARSVRPLAFPFAAALAPSLLTLAVWKQRGLGGLPIFSAQPPVEAAGIGTTIDRYLRIDFGHLHDVLAGFDEFFVSDSVLVWLTVAGLAGAWRIAPAKGAVLTGWLLAFVLFKGSSPEASVDSGSFFRLVLPAIPAFVIALACIPFLVPTLGPRLRRAYAPPPIPWFRRRDGLAVEAVALLGVVPLAVVIGLEPLQGARVAKDLRARTFVGVDNDLALEARRIGDAWRLSWSQPDTDSTQVFYRVYRSLPVFYGPDPSLPPAIDGIRCVIPPTEVPDCRLEMTGVTTTRRRFAYVRPPEGRWTYRVGLAANWADDPGLGDVLMLGPPITIAGPEPE